jgi:peptide/nickel transport system permease protein
MLKFTARRMLQLIPLLFLSSILVFLLIHLAPGDPALLLLGVDASDEDLEAIRAKWGLDKPLPVQYAAWIGRVLRGDFGTSYQNRFPVFKLIKLRLPATIELAAAAFIFSSLVGFSTGILAALKERSWLDIAITTFNTLILATPSFWLGLLLILLFTLYLDWLPPSGRPAGLLDDPGKAWKYMLLPTLSLGLSQGAVLSRFVKSSLLDVMTQDYIRTARAKGLRERVVIVRHALRNAMIPVLTIMGINLARLLSGTVVVETVFAWPGLGQLTIDAVANRDYAVVQGALLLTVAIVLFVNWAVDMTYATVDPRIRL